MGRRGSLNVPMQLFCNKSLIITGKVQLVSVSCLLVHRVHFSAVFWISLFNVFTVCSQMVHVALKSFLSRLYDIEQVKSGFEYSG